jgi:hypothetical protein
MIARLTLASLIGLAAAGSALALIPAVQVTGIASSANETIIEKNQYWPVLGPVTVEPCATESCMEVQS